MAKTCIAHHLNVEKEGKGGGGGGGGGWRERGRENGKSDL